MRIIRPLRSRGAQWVSRPPQATGPSLIRRALVVALVLPPRPGAVWQTNWYEGGHDPASPNTPARAALVARLPARVVWTLPGPPGASMMQAVSMPPGSPVLARPRRGVHVANLRGQALFVRPPRAGVTFAPKPPLIARRVPPAQPGSSLRTAPPRPLVTFVRGTVLLARRGPPPLAGSALRVQPPRLFMMMPGHGAQGPRIVTPRPPARPGAVVFNRPPGLTVIVAPKPPLVVRRTPPGQGGASRFPQPPRLTVPFAPKLPLVVRRTPPGQGGASRFLQPPRLTVTFAPKPPLVVRRAPPRQGGATRFLQPPRVLAAPPLGSALPLRVVRRVPPGFAGAVLFSRRPLPFVTPRRPLGTVAAVLPPGRRGTVLTLQPPRLFMMMPGHGAQGPRIVTPRPLSRPGAVLLLRRPPAATFPTPGKPPDIFSRVLPGKSGAVIRVQPPRLFMIMTGRGGASLIVRRVPPGTAGGVVFSRRPLPFITPKAPPARVISFLPPGRRGSARLIAPPRPRVVFGIPRVAVIRRMPPGNAGAVWQSGPGRQNPMIVTHGNPRAKLTLRPGPAATLVLNEG